MTALNTDPTAWKRYGVWLFTSPRPLSDSRIWREREDWSPLPTVFFRGIGVRPNQDGYGLAYKGVIGEWRTRDRRISLTGIVDQCFAPARIAIQRTQPVHGAVLARVTGYAVVHAHGLRYRPVGSLAIFLGSCMVSERDDG